MKREYDELSEDKNESELCNIALSEQAEIIVKELNSMHGQAKKKIEELIETLRTKDKLKDNEIKKVLFQRVNFVSRRTLYNALPQDLKREYTKTINLSTKHKVIEVETEEDFELPSNLPVTTPETIIMKSEGEQAEAQYLLEQSHAEELSIKQAEVQPLIDNGILTEDKIFAWLKTKSDDVNIIYHETIGIEKFKRDYTSSSINRGFHNYHHVFFELMK